MEHKLGDKFRLGDEIYQRREESEGMFDKLANFQGKLAYLSHVLQKIQLISSEPPEVLWSKFDSYLLSLITPLKKLEEINQNVILLMNTFAELSQ